MHYRKWQDKHLGWPRFFLKPKNDEAIKEYYLRLDDRMKIVYAASYWALFGTVALFTGTTFMFHVFNTVLAVFYYFFMRSNMRGDKYYKIYFDLNSWLHLITANIVWAIYTPAMEDVPFWQIMWPVLAAFVFFFSLSRFLEWRMDVYVKRSERKYQNYEEELRVKREQKRETESDS